MTISELRSLASGATSGLPAYERIYDPIEDKAVFDAMVAAVNALPALLDIAESIHVCREHGFDCGGYGVWLHDHAKARAALKALLGSK